MNKKNSVSLEGTLSQAFKAKHTNFQNLYGTKEVFELERGASLFVNPTCNLVVEFNQRSLVEISVL